MVRGRRRATRPWCPLHITATTNSSRGGDGDDAEQVGRSDGARVEAGHTAVAPSPCYGNDNHLSRASTTRTTRSRSVEVTVRGRRRATRPWCPLPATATTTSSQWRRRRRRRREQVGRSDGAREEASHTVVVPSPYCGNNDQLSKSSTTTTRNRSAAVMVRGRRRAIRPRCPLPAAATTASSRRRRRQRRGAGRPQ
jgi:hypothetical protein